MQIEGTTNANKWKEKVPEIMVDRKEKEEG